MVLILAVYLTILPSIENLYFWHMSGCLGAFMRISFVAGAESKETISLICNPGDSDQSSQTTRDMLESYFYSPQNH